MVLFSCKKKSSEFQFVELQEKERVLKNVDVYFNAKPITVTTSYSERSAGGIHDYYSEGDYWWPNPKYPDSAYIRKDGLTNPNNFNNHREALLRLNHIAGTLTSAFLITNNKKYLKQLIPHLQAWFVNEETKMNPNLMYAQAIKGRITGRGIGIIDTVHLVEVAKSVEIIEQENLLSIEDSLAIKHWFEAYLQWLTTHKFGIDERNNGNNHSVCWTMQVAAFASLVKNDSIKEFCKSFYKTELLPNQMDAIGGFPKELKRTKPYGYSLFNIDAMASVCQLLSTKNDNLFTYKTKKGKSLELGLNFIFPYIKNKNKWPYPKDVLHWNEWPVRQSSLLFGGINLNNQEYLQVWKSLNGDYSTPEIVRNMPVKYPLLWINKYK